MSDRTIRSDGPTPLELAIQRAMRRNDPNAAAVLERDAHAIAKVVLQHWGDDALRPLNRALELVVDERAKWGLTPPEKRPENRREPKTEGDG